jgi:glyoxylase-like metal-dependent hydrolase (beta-lactamase superfamily II)
MTGAEVYASAVERPSIQGEEPIVRAPGPIRPPNTTLKPTPVHHTVADGEKLPVFGGLIALHTPGHSPGHVSFWQPEKKVLFVGDVLFNMPRLSLPWFPMTADAELNKKSVKRVAELDAQVVCFGHGNPLMPDGGQKIKVFAQKIGVM